MDVSVPVRKGLAALRNHGPLPTAHRALSYYGIFGPVWNTVTSQRPIGTNVFDRDWDLLVILDACRPDTLTPFADSVSCIDGVDRLRSVGSMSAEWMLKTFTRARREEIAETAFVSGNIWSHRIFQERFHEHHDHEYDMIHDGFPKWDPVSVDAFAHYETVYPFANQNRPLHPESEHVPHVLTDRAITVGRQEEFQRMVVHYTLPHLNHVAKALDWTPGVTPQSELMSGDLDVRRNLRPEEKSFDPVKRGECSAQTVRENFVANVRLALAYVEILLQNVDADSVVISADHGEGLGERGVWGHPYGYPFSPIKSVPWATTTATDEQTYRPRYERLERPPTEREITEHLEALGYYPS